MKIKIKNKSDVTKFLKRVKEYEKKNGVEIFLIPHADFGLFKLLNKQKFKKQFDSALKDGNNETFDEFFKRRFDESKSASRIVGTTGAYSDDPSYFYPVYRKIWEFEKLTDEIINHTDLQRRLAIFQKIDFDLFKKIYFTMVDIEIFHFEKLYKAFIKTDLLKNLTKKQKQQLKEEAQQKIFAENEITILEVHNQNILQQRGSINQYFRDWNTETLSMKKNLKRRFYEEEFRIINHELKNYPFEKFSQNFRADKSKRQKALRNIKLKR